MKIADIEESIVDSIAGHVEFEAVLGEGLRYSLPDSDTAESVVNDEIDRALIYTQDIRSLWDELGEPDPEDLGNCSGIASAIECAVSETLWCQFDASELLDRAALEWLESHRSCVTDVECYGINLDASTMEELGDVMSALDEAISGYGHDGSGTDVR